MLHEPPPDRFRDEARIIFEVEADLSGLCYLHKNSDGDTGPLMEEGTATFISSLADKRVFREINHPGGGFTMYFKEEETN